MRRDDAETEVVEDLFELCGFDVPESGGFNEFVTDIGYFFQNGAEVFLGEISQRVELYSDWKHDFCSFF